MNRSRLSVVAVCVALFLLTAANIWLAPDFEREESATSFGVESGGYKAAFDLLSELGFAVSRGYEPPSRLPKDRPVWFIEPGFLEPADEQGEKDVADLRKWVHSGGTAVVFGGARSAWKRFGIDERCTIEKVETITGPLAPAPRQVPSFHPCFPPPAANQRVLLRGGPPLALEIAEGSGTLVLVSDSAFLRNVNLTQSDSSVLLVDFVRSLGVPVFDERSHGFAPPVSFFGLLVRSRAVWTVAFALAALVCWIGERRLWPRRTLSDETDGPVPSVTTFVESLGTIYSRVSDHASVFRAYRSGFLRRLKRQMSARQREMPDDLLLARLKADPALSPDARRWLVDGASPNSQSDLLGAVRAIESFSRGAR